MQNVMKHSVKDDIENVGTLLVQNPATDLHLTVRDLPKILLAVMFIGIAQGSVAGYKDVSNDNVQTLMWTVAQQLVSIDIETGQSSFKSFSSGVLIVP